MRTIEDYNEVLKDRAFLRGEINALTENIIEQQEKTYRVIEEREKMVEEFSKGYAKFNKFNFFTSKVTSLREHIRQDYELLAEEYPEFSYNQLSQVFIEGIYALTEHSPKYVALHWTNGNSSGSRFSNIEMHVSRNRMLEEHTTLLPAAWFLDKNAFEKSFSEKVEAKRNAKAVKHLKENLEKAAKRSVRRAGGEEQVLEAIGGEGTPLDVGRFLLMRAEIDDRKLGAFSYPYVAVENLVVLAQSVEKTLTHENIQELLVDPLTAKVESLIVPHEIALNRVHVDTFKEILVKC